MKTATLAILISLLSTLQTTRSWASDRSISIDPAGKYKVFVISKTSSQINWAVVANDWTPVKNGTGEPEIDALSAPQRASRVLFLPGYDNQAIQGSEVSALWPTFSSPTVSKSFVIKRVPNNAPEKDIFFDVLILGNACMLCTDLEIKAQTQLNYADLNQLEPSLPTEIVTKP